jgi:HSP20 family protein
MLTRYRPTSNVDPFRVFANEIDRFFNQNIPSISEGSNGRVGFVPPLDVWHDAEAVHVETELPGFKLDDIEILATPEELTIRGERRTREDAGDTQPVHSERSYGRFERSVSLPTQVDVDRAEARFEDGVLRIDVPKTSESRVKRISIGSGAENAG